MRSRKSFWILLCLLCLAGAWFFWHQSSRAPQKKIVAKPTIVTVRSASTAPQFLTKPTIVAKTVKTGTSVTNKFAYRLSNTSKSIGELVSDDKAILLENALIDLRNPLNFSIPKNLQSQGDPGAYIVQANGPIDNAFRAMLAAAGATIVSYIPNDAYLVRAPASVANGIAADGFSVIPYEPYYKVQSSLLAFDEKSLPDGTALNLGLFGDDAPATIQQIEKLGGQVFAEDASPFGKIVRVIPPQNWTALATLPGVQLVEPFRKRVLANDLARVTLGVSTDTVTSTNYMNLTGKNVMVEMNDSGVDAAHPDLTMARVFGDAASSLVDTNGHGTHVAGIIAGDGTVSDTIDGNSNSLPQGSVLDSVSGNTDFRGKAPLAKLYSVGGVEGDDTNVITDAYLQEQPALTNALISNNSWVYDGNNVYDLAAASYDAAVRDALPGVTGSQPVLFIFAAGNDGAGDDNGGSGIADSIQSPATAKNVITVGATEQLRNITNYVTASDGSSNQFWLLMTDSSSQVAGYSSRGNVGIGIEGANGRFKPDVVAPGTFVVSTRSEQWDQAAYYNPTNFDDSELPDQFADVASINFYQFAIPENVVQITVSNIANSSSPTPFPSLPILVWKGTDPRAANPNTTGSGSISISGAALTPVGTTWTFAVTNNTGQAVSYDLFVEIVTTNDNGNYFEVLSNQLNNPIGPWYRYESGTSMAAPAVSGVLALMQDYFTNTLHATPSPALMKAMVINGARQTDDYNFEVGNALNFQGWGLVNLPDALPPGITSKTGVSCSSFILDQSPTNALATGDSQTFFVSLTNEDAQAQPLRVTVAWTDPPGNPAAAIKLVNDLNLVVTNLDDPANPIIYYGNDITDDVFNNPEFPGTPPVFDAVNNIENVYIAPLTGTNYSITVIGNRVNVNAVTAQTNNSVGMFAPNVVQDYALVISSGDGQITNAMIVSNVVSFVSNPTGDQQITDVTNSNAPLLNQFVGANSPLLATNALLFTNTTPQGFSGNWQDTIGMTNQWHFYVVTNINSANFTNAAFITFEPNTLSIPRAGVFADSTANATRPEADIDLYVTTDSNLLVLNPLTISNCIVGTQIGGTVGGNFNGASLSRGGTEYVVDTNSFASTSSGEVYYIGIKSEDQEASEYDFLPVFTTNNFSVLEPNGDEIVNGVQLPINIPDGSPSLPGVAYIIGLALYPMEVGSVVATDQIWHQNFGDLIGPLKHNDISAVLNNHDSLGNTIGDPPFVYDDSGAGVAGSRPSDGPGSLNNFRGTEGIGPWILTEVDDSLTQTGSVQQFSLQIQPHQTGDNSHTNTVQSLSWFTDFVDVPPGATNLTITVTNLSPIANPPLELFVKYGALPTPLTTNDWDEMTLITNVDTLGLDGSITISAPLTAGRYYYGVYNPSATAQQFFVNWTVLPPNPTAPQVDFSSSGPATILDDAIMTNSIFVSPGGIILSVDVGLAVNDPRISDLVFHLISPDGTRVLLMENRGGTSASGAGAMLVSTNSNVTNYSYLVFTEDANLTTTPIKFAVPPFVSTTNSDLYYLPEQSLDTYAGENAAGEWLLEIQDDRAGAGLTNTLGSWQLRFNFTTSTTSLTNSQTATNSLQPGGIAYYLVNVPTNADFATNFLFTTGGPLNFWFNETAPPSGTGSPGDYLLFNTSVNDSNVLSTIPSPTNIVPGGTYYLAVQNTNTFAVTNFAVEVDFHLLTVTNLIGGQPQTNTVAPGSFAYYAVSVPTNADIATNILQFATGPVNLLFNQTTLPSGLGAGDVTLLSASTVGSTNLTLAGSPPLVPGQTYYLGVQNTNNVPVNFGIEVDFHLLVLTNPPIIISSIIQTNINGTNGFWLTWFAPSNDLFQVQWTSNLAPPQVWNTFTNIVSYNTNVFTSPTNTQFNFFDDGSQFPFGLLRFYRLILLGSGLTNGAPQTNSIPPGGIAYYSINVPTNADFSTNSLFMTNGPLNLLFSQTVPPTGTNSGDYLLFSASANASAILSTNSPPPFFVPGGTYYLGVQNTNSFAVNYSIEVDFHLFTLTNPPTNSVSISSITYTNIGGTNDILLRWIAPANYQFQIQWVTNLAAPIAWNTISNVVITSTTTNYSYLDDGSLTDGFGPLKFYRLIEYPYSTPIPMSLSIANAQFTAGGIQFQWSAPTNYQYEIQWTTNLALPSSNWFILTSPALSVTNTVFTFTDTNQTGPSTITKFFRLIAAP